MDMVQPSLLVLPIKDDHCKKGLLAFPKKEKGKV